jgi:hypothetical protein
MKQHNAPTATLATKDTDEPRFGRMESVVAAKVAKTEHGTPRENAHCNRCEIAIADEQRPSNDLDVFQDKSLQMDRKEHLTTYELRRSTISDMPPP